MKPLSHRPPSKRRGPLPTGKPHARSGLALACLAHVCSIPVAGAQGTAPAFTEDWLIASDAQAYAWFGRAVDLEGDTLVVGAFGHDFDNSFQGGEGAAYVFEKAGDEWIQTARLVAPDALMPQVPDRFGRTVALSGDTVAVCSWHDGLENGWRDGSVYVYERQGGDWRFVQKILNPEGGLHGTAWFGNSISLERDTMIIGAPLDEDPPENYGQAYFYERVGNQWQYVQRLEASDRALGDEFGWSSALLGDWLVIGAYRHDHQGANSGAAYLFRWSGGVWTETQKLTDPAPVTGGYFGIQLALHGDRLAVTAPPAPSAPSSYKGRLHTYLRSGTTWTHEQHFVMDDEPGFGLAVDLNDEYLIASNLLGTGAASYTGNVQVYRREGDTWVERGRLFAPDGMSGDDFGREIRISGTRVAVGVPGDGVALPLGSTGVGSAYVYTLLPDELVTVSCACDAGAPCGNTHAGAGCRNSTGVGATLSANGSTSLGTDDLVLMLQGLPPQQAGLVFTGSTLLQAPFGDGLRCVGGLTARFPVEQGGANGVITVGPGLAAHAHANFPIGLRWLAGQTWHFQGWYRDPSGPCGSGFNTSDALAALFVP